MLRSIGRAVEGMALSTGWRTGGRSLRRDYSAAFAIGLAGIALHLRRSIPGEAETDGHDAGGNGMEGTGAHHAAQGPRRLQIFVLDRIECQ